MPGKLKKKKKKREDAESDMKDQIKEEENVDIFSKAVVSDDFRTSIKTILQSESIGNLPFNTVLLDFLFNA